MITEFVNKVRYQPFACSFLECTQQLHCTKRNGVTKEIDLKTECTTKDCQSYRGME